MTVRHLKLLFIFIGLFVLSLFIIKNAEGRAKFDLIFLSFENVPVIFLMFLSFSLGVFIMWLYQFFALPLHQLNEKKIIKQYEKQKKDALSEKHEKHEKKQKK